MPIITAFPNQPRAWVRVEINWADTPSVQYARVLRYNTVTGECEPLRPYICYNGDYLLLSCGHGIFFDTEVPFDVPVYYITEGLDAPCIPDPDPCVPCTPTTADTSLDPVTIESDGQFWLRDPVRPCHDRAVPLCFTPANNAAESDGTFCIPASGIFFASMGTEAYEPNTLTLNPTNARRPLAMSRQRRDVSSVLTLVTRTFDDRDALLALTEPGSPLYFAGPAAYGIPRRWMDVGTVSFERGLSDHKYQVRVADLPFVAVDRPAGPTQGTCGSQVSDLCDIYATWDDMAAAGLTWDDLIRGLAGSETAPDFAAYRRWTAGANSVLNSFADWNAVDNGTRTWTDLEVGL